MYGLIFEDYITGYSFWGICDIDMIFGDLSTFITDAILDKYNKVYQLGHLTLYRNTREMNNSYKLDGYINWDIVVQTPIHCRLCERGMMKKHSLAGLSVYAPLNYADISKIHKRYQLSHWLVPKENRDCYRHQVFYSDNGHVYRAILENGEIRREEFCYIHLQKRKLNVNYAEIGDSFYITQNTFISKQTGIPESSEIVKLNPYPGRLYEILECIIYELKTHNIMKRIVERLHIKAISKK